MSRRVLAALLAASAVSLALFALPLAELVQEYYRDQTVVALHEHAASAAPGLSADRNVASALNDDGDHRLGLYDRTGGRVAGFGPERADQVVTAALDGTATSAVADDGGVSVAMPLSGAQNFAVVRGESPASVIDAHVRRAWAAIAALAAAVFAVVGLGAWVLSRRLVRPVRWLTTDLARLGDGDFATSPTRTGVAEIDAAYDALAVTAGRLDDTLERERAFSADVAHQLRTPITSLRLAIESELAAPRPDPTVALREALVDVDRLQTTSEDLLALARSLKSQAAPIDLRPVLTELGQRWNHRFQSAGRRLTVSPGDGHEVVAHSGRLAQALDILVDNALQHGAGTTTVTAAGHAGHVNLAVSDEGPGITRNAAPAGSNEPARRSIGLDLARRLVETDGGRLQVPTGSHPSVTITLPAGHGNDPTGPPLD